MGLLIPYIFIIFFFHIFIHKLCTPNIQYLFDYPSSVSVFIRLTLHDSVRSVIIPRYSVDYNKGNKNIVIDGYKNHTRTDEVIVDFFVILTFTGSNFRSRSIKCTRERK